MCYDTPCGISTCCYSYDHPHILAGQGTMGLEIIEQVPDVDAVVIPVGGGGLIAGAALALKNLKPSVQIIVSIRAISLYYIGSYVNIHALFINKMCLNMINYF